MRDASLCLSVKSCQFQRNKWRTKDIRKKKKRQKKRKERAKIKQILAKVSFRTTVLFNCLNRFPPSYLAGFPCIDFVHWCLVFGISFNCHRKATEAVSDQWPDHVNQDTCTVSSWSHKSLKIPLSLLRSHVGVDYLSLKVWNSYGFS